MDIQTQKNWADVILARLEKEGYYAILAGGAPRDWDHGLVANDLDIYIHAPQSVEMEDALAVGAMLSVTNRVDRLEDEKYEDVGHFSTYEFVTEDEQGVQFVFVTEAPEGYVKNQFTSSICKIWYDGEFHTTWEYRVSKDHKVIVDPELGRAHSEKLNNRREWRDHLKFASWRYALRVFGAKESPVPGAIEF